MSPVHPGYPLLSNTRVDEGSVGRRVPGTGRLPSKAPHPTRRVCLALIMEIVMVLFDFSKRVLSKNSIQKYFQKQEVGGGPAGSYLCSISFLILFYYFATFLFVSVSFFYSESISRDHGWIPGGSHQVRQSINRSS